MKIKLLYKGLFLVAIPLVFELCIFGYLIKLQNQVEQEAQRINRNKMINDSVNAIVHDCISITDATQGYSMIPSIDRERTTRALVTIKERMMDIDQQFGNLRELSRGDPSISRQVLNCGIAFKQTRDDLLALRASMQKCSFDDLPLVLNHGRKRLDVDIHACLRAGVLELGEESRKQTDDKAARQMREQERLILHCAIAASCIIAVVVAFVFGQNLAKRLTLLGANANRMAKGEPLLAAQGGTDEVAELDRNIHYAAQLIEAAKRMRQEVMAMITHDLKTPLQSIKSYYEMLEGGMLGELNDKGKRLLGISQNSIGHMTQLIDSVLELEKLRTGKVLLKTEPVELSSLLDKCVQSVKVFADSKHVSLITEYNHEPADTVRGDEFWLQEVFVNILSNAIKFTDENTKVTVATKTTGRKVEISVADQGPGISKEEVAMIFERFHRAETAAPVAGSGLGLSIAKELIELHLGSISVESQVGHGSTFIVRLPVTQMTIQA